MTSRNPLIPAFGKIPPYMAGRQDELDVTSERAYFREYLEELPAV